MSEPASTRGDRRPPDTPLTALLTLPEVAPYFRKTPRTMWNWRAAGTFPVPLIEINGRPYVRVVDLEAFLGRPLDELVRRPTDGSA